jgi:hypothetical protein
MPPIDEEVVATFQFGARELRLLRDAVEWRISEAPRSDPALPELHILAQLLAIKADVARCVVGERARE